MPRPWVETALLQVDGLIDFARKDVAKALAALDGPSLRTEVADGLRAYAAALGGYRDFLRARLRRSPTRSRSARTASRRCWRPRRA